LRKSRFGQRVGGVADLALAGRNTRTSPGPRRLQLGDGVADGLDLVAVGSASGSSGSTTGR
jgi:hypothetical protein